MCNACGFYCCAYDGFSRCGCDHCPNRACWPDDEEDYRYDEGEAAEAAPTRMVGNGCHQTGIPHLLQRKIREEAMPQVVGHATASVRRDAEEVESFQIAL